MAIVWNPRSVLDVNPESSAFTCVGKTKKGLRCGNKFIKHAYLAEAGEILDDLPALVRSRRRSYELLSTLKRLAFLTLCPRWHQEKIPQVEPVAHRWLAIIQQLGVVRSSAPLPTPPTTPPPITRPTRRHSSNHPDPPSTTAERTRRAEDTPSTSLSPSPTPSSTDRSARGHNSRRARDVNISLNIAVDSNQIIPGHARGTHRHVPTSPTISTTSSRSSRTSSSSSTSSSSNSRPSPEDAIARLGRQIDDINRRLEAALQARARSRSSRSSVSHSHGARSPSLAPSAVPSNVSSDAEASESDSESSNSDSDSDFELGSDTDSDSDHSGPPGSGPGINTPSSSGRFSPVIFSPARSSRSSRARSGAPSPSSASANSATSAHVRRRPITTDTTCYVCYDPIARAADAAWCRGGCGQNICLGCYVKWVGQQTEDREEINCGFCRAPWMF